MTSNGFRWIAVFFVSLALTALAGAQPGPLGQNIFVEPNPGEAAQWEAAYEQHLAWHREMNDSWGWTTYQMMSGPRVGQYLVRSGGHEWKDFDERGDTEQKDLANYEATAGKHTKSIMLWFDRTHRHLSRIPEGGGPYKVVEFTRVMVKPAKVPEFMNLVGKYHEAFGKTNSRAAYAIAQTETGGSTSNFLFVGLHESFASLEQPADGIPKMMEEVYGRQDADGIDAAFWSCVDAMESYIAVLREDLTYRPADTTSNE